MSKELIEVVHPETNTPTGLVLPRHEIIKNKHWCRSTNVFVMNHDGQILVHQRSLEKERYPGAWSTHLGGHVGHGETYESNALKELEEEAGIIVPKNALVPVRTTKIGVSNLWVRDFVTLYHAPAENLKPQPGEVERFMWMHIDEILRHAEMYPDKWLAGTHDIWTEYHCFRAALTAATSLGAMSSPVGFDHWHPLPA